MPSDQSNQSFHFKYGTISSIPLTLDPDFREPYIPVFPGVILHVTVSNLDLIILCCQELLVAVVAPYPKCRFSHPVAHPFNPPPPIDLCLFKVRVVFFTPRGIVTGVQTLNSRIYLFFVHVSICIQLSWTIQNDDVPSHDLGFAFTTCWFCHQNLWRF